MLAIYVIGWDPSMKKWVNYLNCIVGEGEVEKCSGQTAALFVDLFWNISFFMVVYIWERERDIEKKGYYSAYNVREIVKDIVEWNDWYD